jgi:hypothetical protein
MALSTTVIFSNCSRPNAQYTSAQALMEQNVAKLANTLNTVYEKFPSGYAVAKTGKLQKVAGVAKSLDQNSDSEDAATAITDYGVNAVAAISAQLPQFETEIESNPELAPQLLAYITQLCNQILTSGIPEFTEQWEGMSPTAQEDELYTLSYQGTMSSYLASIAATIPTTSPLESLSSYVGVAGAPVH